MSVLICSVMGMVLTASGEMYLVKMVTASFSRTEKNNRKKTKSLSSSDSNIHRRDVYTDTDTHTHDFVSHHLHFNTVRQRNLCSPNGTITLKKPFNVHRGMSVLWVEIGLCFQVLYLGRKAHQLIGSSKLYIFKVMLVASKKEITQK